MFREAEVFANISLTRNTVAERVSDISANLDSQLKKKVKSFVIFSVALDESTDISDVAQQAIFIRGVDETLSVSGIPGVGAYDGYHNNQWYFQPSLGC